MLMETLCFTTMQLFAVGVPACLQHWGMADRKSEGIAVCLLACIQTFAVDIDEWIKLKCCTSVFGEDIVYEGPLGSEEVDR
eukprot:UN09693